MSIFPFFGDEVIEEAEQPLYKETAWDYERNCPIIEDGSFKIVTGNEAIKSWAYRALQTIRYRHEIYSWEYGSEIENLIGTQYTEALAQAECIRYIKECLMVNSYITDVSNIKTVFNNAKGLLSVTCDLETVYGSERIEGVNISV